MRLSGRLHGISQRKRSAVSDLEENQVKEVVTTLILAPVFPKRFCSRWVQPSGACAPGSAPGPTSFLQQTHWTHSTSLLFSGIRCFMFASSELICFPKHLNNRLKSLLDGESQVTGEGPPGLSVAGPQGEHEALSPRPHQPDGVSGQIP